MDHSVVDFLLEDLKELLNGRTELILVEKSVVVYLQKELTFLGAFLKDAQEKYSQNEEVKNLSLRIKEVTYGALEILDSLIVNDLDSQCESGQMSFIYISGFDYFSWIRKFAKEVKFISKEVVELYEKKVLDSEVIAKKTYSGECSSSVRNLKVGEDVVVGFDDEAIKITEGLGRNLEVEEDGVVGFDDEAMKIIERLTGNGKQLDVISVVGMAGLGKTTLARKVYKDPYIVSHFHVCGWTNVSQVYRKRDMLLNILSSVVEQKDEFYAMTDEKLEEELHRRLLGKRYFIVIDDLWNTDAWDDLKRSFPDKRNGSRILITTRLTDVAKSIQPDSCPHSLRFLTEDESWDLLQRKAFHKGTCPMDLVEIGKRIGAKCQGLPLAIVVLAGILAKKEKTRDSWTEIAESASSHAGSDQNQLLDILGMSFEQLPPCLKPCFLYFAVFPEDYEVPVWRLTCLWVAEGLVKHNGDKNMQATAEDYLMDLVDRNLVMISKRKSNGRIKTCRVHDTLRDLCLRKRRGENPVDLTKQCEQDFSLSSFLQGFFCFHSHGYHYVSTTPCYPSVRISLLGSSAVNQCPSKSFLYSLLRVLDLGYICLDVFPREILRLVHLRYLALQIYNNPFLPLSLSNLWNLDTFILSNGPLPRVILPFTIWKMVKLRHLYIHGVEFECPHSIDGYPFLLERLETISSLRVSYFSNQVLASIPNLRKLGLQQNAEGWKSIRCPSLTNLVHLEALKLTAWGWKSPWNVLQLSEFPPNLKELTLLGGVLDETVLSTVGMLPNLEVLKLKNNFFSNSVWETTEGQFCRLKFLKIQDGNLVKWSASGYDFPSLQRLVLDGCQDLEGIPTGIGDIPTLQIIELYWSSKSSVNSARQIQEEQLDMGNDEMKIVIYPSQSN